MAFAIAIATGIDGGLLVVTQGNRWRVPVADFESGDNALALLQAAMRRETGFTSLDWIHLGPLNAESEGQDRFYWARNIERSAPLRDGAHGWLPLVDGSVVRTLRDFATRCPEAGRVVYEEAARHLEAYLDR